MKADRPFSHLRHIPGQSLTYGQNPKAACTSIEKTLWQAHTPGRVPGNVHVPLAQTPFVTIAEATPADIDSLLASTFFSVVRNPYVRLLSAYIEKTKPKSWPAISRRVGFSPDVTPGIADLLESLLNRDVELTDKHFRPQHVVLVDGITPLDYLGHLERIEDVRSFLAGHGMALQHFAPHATDAANRISEYLGPREIAAAQRYYQRDFELFGYDDDPTVLGPVRAPAPLSSGRAKLRQWIEGRMRSSASGDLDSSVARRRAKISP